MAPARLPVPRTPSRWLFGTETHGVELPIVKPDFQTNVPGLFIAGALGGMGLIRNAMESIKVLCAGGVATDMLDVVIVAGKGHTDSVALLLGA